MLDSRCRVEGVLVDENLRDSVGTTSQGLLAGLARPDADGGATDSVLAAEGASVAGVLGHFLLCGVVSNLMSDGA